MKGHKIVLTCVSVGVMVLINSLLGRYLVGPVLGDRPHLFLPGILGFALWCLGTGMLSGFLPGRYIK